EFAAVQPILNPADQAVAPAVVEMILVTRRILGPQDFDHRRIGQRRKRRDHPRRLFETAEAAFGAQIGDGLKGHAVENNYQAVWQRAPRKNPSIQPRLQRQDQATKDQVSWQPNFPSHISPGGEPTSSAHPYCAAALRRTSWSLQRSYRFLPLSRTALYSSEKALRQSPPQQQPYFRLKR